MKTQKQKNTVFIKCSSQCFEDPNSWDEFVKLVSFIVSACFNTTMQNPGKYGNAQMYMCMKDNDNALSVLPPVEY